MNDQASRTLGALLYEDFELLDLFGPLEMFGNMQGAVTVRTVADRPGLVRSAQGPRVHADHGLEDCPPLDLLLLPAGIGTRTQVESARLVDWLRACSGELEVAMTVCTGSALLAAAGLLDGRRTTTNVRFCVCPRRRRGTLRPSVANGCKTIGSYCTVMVPVIPSEKCTEQ